MAMLDVLVIGGGITGVGVAQAAVAAGYSVALWERGALASGTSSHSSKLIHGGLRYLESGQLTLVRRCLHARRQLLQLAPELVKAVPFYIPLYQDSQRGLLTLSAGLSLYGLLSQGDPLGKFTRVNLASSEQHHLLQQQGLRHMLQYWDAQTDDKALTMAVAASAQQLGAEIQQYRQVTDIYHGARVCQVRYRDSDGTLGERRVKMIINATGPWASELLANVTPKQMPAAMTWVQGSHLLLDIESPVGIYYLESRLDERVFFVMPWKNKTLIGTTEVALATMPDKPQITCEEYDYLLDNYHHYFTQYSRAELASLVIGNFCGVRALPAQAGSAFSRARETLFVQQANSPRLVSVYGGKLTEFMPIAQDVLAMIRAQLGERHAIADINTRAIVPVADDYFAADNAQPHMAL
ncbi:glycerol-3-phosphate dehydrogenase/oxidase [Shewanella sp. NIFS-20-20]|uniref:glycerol-3-phosphate dehydrogenase/oxidase n=1 Tax=Shewanella sp. NIFS-20-20 TaxID=2853806 RepID=UPI001C44F325|nr:FAD-dependent oxidoreductase [Shewanella sp. NIFS-20-20]MBV7316509.1 FAD-dependent oxidoreductase [Shewanella sp. NIFS-20-20]